MRVHAFPFHKLRCVCGCVRPFKGGVHSSLGDTVLKLFVALSVVSPHIYPARRSIGGTLESAQIRASLYFPIFGKLD